MPHLPATWLRADGRLDPERLMDAFLAFWRQHGQPLLGTAPYREIAPHLVLMAFLHRVANVDRRPEQPPIAERTHAFCATTPSGRRVTVVRA